ncbi:hypothetical protein HU675_0016230 [Bradyrhizobium septentrionale]|uniref:hypothetical protein n=1 Tax=Bradyrhizobium septentrionale TaxID=1404411 RepID=UPI0015964A7C|nr:hypothetical protein [Bradyrhizobium septentrionale]UGY28177.1 hypothetical protein HU675_0016230 [Bradyrhizobium septentrionale]
MSSRPPWADKKLTEKQRADMAFRYQDWLLTKNVPNGGFRLLYAITQCFNEVNQFHCWPSLDYLAARIVRKPQTVWEMLPKLEKLDVIEIEWGSQGSGNSNKYTLPAAFLEFYFGPEKGRLPKLEVPKKPRRAEVSDPLENSGSAAGKLRFDPEKTSASLSEPLIATDSHKKERGSAARSADDDRLSAPTSSATADQRADALVGPAQPPPERNATKEIGRPGANGADAAPAAVRDLARDVLGGDKADALLPGLLRAYDGDAEEVETALLAAKQDFDPVGYIEDDIARQARWSGGQ